MADWLGRTGNPPLCDQTFVMCKYANQGVCEMHFYLSSHKKQFFEGLISTCIEMSGRAHTQILFKEEIYSK